MADMNSPAFTRMQKIMVLIISPELHDQVAAVTALDFHLSQQPNLFIDQTIHYGIVTYLVNCLRDSINEQLKYQSALALTKITNGTFKQTMIVVAAGGLPVLIQNLTSRTGDHRMLGAVMVCLGNIISEGEDLRNYIVTLGVVPPLLELKTHIDISIRRDLVFVIINLCRYLAFPQDMRNVLSTLIFMIDKETDVQILTDALYSLSNWADAGVDEVENVINTGILTKLFSLISHETPMVQIETIKTLACIVAGGTDEHVKKVLDGGVLSLLCNLLGKVEVGICALQFLTNVICKSDANVQAVIDSKSMPPIIDHLETGGFITQKERTVVEMTVNGKIEQTRHLVISGAMLKFCDKVRATEPPKKSLIIGVIFNGIMSILESPNIGESDRKEVIRLISANDVRNRIETYAIGRPSGYATRKSNMIMNFLIKNENHEDPDLLPNPDRDGILQFDQNFGENLTGRDFRF